jgi:DNA-binding LacI/PurR family transcriptional regulator
MTTLKDIAREAGVSVMTVSRVVNKQYGKVSMSNVARIQAIIKDKGYVPNSSARSLSSKSTRLIAVIVQGEENALEYPYNATMVGHICYYIQSKGYSPLLYFVSEYSEVTKRLRQWNVEGAVFLGMFDENVRSIREDNRIPLVFTDSYSSVRQVTNIGLDDYKGGELAAQYLIGKGHRNVAFVGTSTNLSGVVRHRMLGFKHSLEEAGLKLPDSNIIEEYLINDRIKEICQYSPPVTAFFVTADIVAMNVMDELKALGLRVPEDYSIIGFDNLFFSAYTTPKLTTISQDIRKKAQIAIEVLFRHISTPNSPAESIVLDVQLIERESVHALEYHS